MICFLDWVLSSFDNTVYAPLCFSMASNDLFLLLFGFIMAFDKLLHGSTTLILSVYMYFIHLGPPSRHIIIYKTFITMSIMINGNQ